MAIFLAATLAMCTFVVMWALGRDPDVDALVALVILGIGILIHLISSSSSDLDEEEA